MGERKGVNKYYPPDYRPEKGSLNKYHGTHALRERARKLPQGILIIRFEMPYNIWCEGCNNHIGMGVRYNAEKKKVGMYYSTPIFQFRMKCHLCPNHIEMKTDPQNFDYIVVSGARRQERRWDPHDNDQVVPEDKDTSKKLATDAMFKLEHGTDDQRKGKEAAPVLARLEDVQERWRDDYMSNKHLRKIFRDKKKELQSKEKANQSLLIKSSLNIKLVDENPQDVKLASLLKLTATESFEERQKQKRQEIESRPLFSATLTDKNQSSGKKSSKNDGITSSVIKMPGSMLVRHKNGPIAAKSPPSRDSSSGDTESVVNDWRNKSLVAADYDECDSDEAVEDCC